MALVTRYSGLLLSDCKHKNQWSLIEILVLRTLTMVVWRWDTGGQLASFIFMSVKFRHSCNNDQNTPTPRGVDESKHSPRLGKLDDRVLNFSATQVRIDLPSINAEPLLNKSSSSIYNWGCDAIVIGSSWLVAWAKYYWSAELSLSHCLGRCPILDSTAKDWPQKSELISWRRVFRIDHKLL